MGKYHFTLFVVASFALIFYQNCAPIHEVGDLENQSSNLNSVESVAIYQSTLYPLIENNCAQCHGVSQQPLFAVADVDLSHSTLINSRLVDLSAPESSRIAVKIANGHQSFAPALAVELETAIASWATQLESARPEGGDPLPTPPPLEATFSSIHTLILVPKCVGCHSSGGERPQENYSTYATTLSTGKVTPGNANDSAMYTECLSGEMPKDAPMLSSEELNIIREWIANGATNN